MKTASLEGKAAIVTGGGRGRGHAMTLGLARAGARVVISAARQTEEVRAVADTVNQELGARRVLALQASASADITGQRLDAARWDAMLLAEQAARAALGNAGWANQASH